MMALKHIYLQNKDGLFVQVVEDRVSLTLEEKDAFDFSSLTLYETKSFLETMKERTKSELEFVFK